MEVTLSGHGAYQLVYHVVWVTKYRRKILNPGMVDCLQSLMPKLARSMFGVIVEQIGFDRDHVHFPKYAVADIMGELKSRSASILREKFNFLKKVYWPENVVWSPGYFVSSVGIDETIIKYYVECKVGRIQASSTWSCKVTSSDRRTMGSTRGFLLSDVHDTFVFGTSF